MCDKHTMKVLVGIVGGIHIVPYGTALLTSFLLDKKVCKVTYKKKYCEIFLVPNCYFLNRKISIKMFKTYNPFIIIILIGSNPNC